MSVPKKRPQPGPGAPLTSEREQYRRLMAQGLNNHQACLQIGVDLVLAKSGEDVDRLVRQPTDPRGALMESVAVNTAPELAGTVDHAVALFRARDANRDEKRSACVALAGVLERRRNLVKLELLAKDERALFQIANDFDVRHRKPEQRADYDDVFLNWLFWWYLATVELTNHLLARQTAVST